MALPCTTECCEYPVRGILFFDSPPPPIFPTLLCCFSSPHSRGNAQADIITLHEYRTPECLLRSTGAPCCGMFSIIGFLFLIILGIIVDKQPIFVHGVTEPHRSAVACYGGGT